MSWCFRIPSLWGNWNQTCALQWPFKCFALIWRWPNTFKPQQQGTKNLSMCRLFFHVVRLNSLCHCASIFIPFLLFIRSFKEKSKLWPPRRPTHRSTTARLDGGSLRTRTKFHQLLEPASPLMKALAKALSFAHTWPTRGWDSSWIETLCH